MSDKKINPSPGEWRYISRNVDNKANWACRIPFAIEVDYGTAVLPIADVCDQPHAEANARLMAASKDLYKEMLRFLPIIERAEADPELWAKLTEGTGIATANAYRAAIAKAAGVA